MNYKTPISPIALEVISGTEDKDQIYNKDAPIAFNHSGNSKGIAMV